MRVVLIEDLREVREGLAALISTGLQMSQLFDN
jgi:hypothetical protein